jgi:hypothetical protein
VSILLNPREISGKEFLADVKTGIDDVGLMRKYEITRRQLKGLLRQLAEAGALDPMERLTLEISSKDFISDFRSGISDAQLMERYHLSPEELDAVCARLKTMGALSQEEWENRIPESDEPG